MDPQAAPESPPSSHYFNRDLSWLEFNARVLEEAMAPGLPLLERIKFMTIFSSNMDEFFMVRVAGLKSMHEEEIEDFDLPDDLDVGDVLERVLTKSRTLVDIQYRFFNETILPELAKVGVDICKIKDLDEAQRAKLRQYYYDNLFPILTPLAIDPAHPFPNLFNLETYIVAIFDAKLKAIQSEEDLIGLIGIPSVIPRLIPVETTPPKMQFILAEDLIVEHIGSLFLGLAVTKCYFVRATRNLDYNLLETVVVDLLKTVKSEMSRREWRDVVRLEVSHDMPANILGKLRTVLEVKDDYVYMINGPSRLNDFSALHRLPMPALKDPLFNPRLPKRLESHDDIFTLISQEDLLVHHPYESFYAVVEFLRTAANDPHVVAIKQTLYRTSGDSPVIDALIKASEKGKHVTAVIELKARFDERNNIEWAERLEAAGVSVVFGFIGLKTHAKATLVVRREMNRLVKYCHLASGNYNSNTAKLYSDIGYFTCNEEIAADVSKLFNILTGFNILIDEDRLSAASFLPPLFNRIAVAPLNLRKRILELIDDEIQSHRSFGNGLVIAKMNALVDQAIIDKLYEASKAGVTIKLCVRGICCLKPGVPGLSEHIEVKSIIDRFLEHSRIFYFNMNGSERVFVASADWMSRNMDRRIELMFPILHEANKRRLVDEILKVSVADNQKSWLLQPDGSYARPVVEVDGVKFRSQERFIEQARQGGVKSIPYEIAMTHDQSPKDVDRPVAKKKVKKPKFSQF